MCAGYLKMGPPKYAVWSDDDGSDLPVDMQGVKRLWNEAVSAYYYISTNRRPLKSFCFKPTELPCFSGSRKSPPKGRVAQH